MWFWKDTDRNWSSRRPSSRTEGAAMVDSGWAINAREVREAGAAVQRGKCNHEASPKNHGRFGRQRPSARFASEAALRLPKRFDSGPQNAVSSLLAVRRSF